MRRWRQSSGGVVLGLWFVSAMSLMADQLRALGQPRSEHPEVPGEDPRLPLDVLEGCRRHLRASDSLGVLVPSGGDIVQLFILYRLAYVLYPAAVTSVAYSGDAVQDGVARLESRRPTHLLIFAAAEPQVPGAVLVSALRKDVFLLRTSRAH